VPDASRGSNQKQSNQIMISIVLDTSFMHKVGEIKAIAKRDEQVKLKIFKRLRLLAICI